MWTEVVVALGDMPKAAMAYLAHTENGVPIRALARDAGCHASTILRQVRRIEQRRDDPLIDQALRRAAQRGARTSRQNGGATRMIDPKLSTNPRPRSSAELASETYRILGRMAEPGACLALAAGMENAVVVREAVGAEPVRTATVSRSIAEALAMNDWIKVRAQGRITRYVITAAGRAAWKRAEAGTHKFGDQHREIEDCAMPGRGRVRYNAAESPLISLARRKNKDGKRFLSVDLVRAGETLREDFELAQMGPRITQNWDRFLTGATDCGAAAGDRHGTGPEAARARVEAALADLGPGLGDVVLRACCYLEGMESIEKRMGWAARSGKIVLRIGLQRLLRHYDERHGGVSPMIG